MSNRRRFGNVPHIREVNNCADLCHKIKEGGWGEDTSSNLQRTWMVTGLCSLASKMISSATTMAVIDFSLQLLENKYHVTTTAL